MHDVAADACTGMEPALHPVSCGGDLPVVRHVRRRDLREQQNATMPPWRMRLVQNRQSGTGQTWLPCMNTPVPALQIRSMP